MSEKANKQTSEQALHSDAHPPKLQREGFPLRLYLHPLLLFQRVQTSVQRGKAHVSNPFARENVDRLRNVSVFVLKDRWVIVSMMVLCNANSIIITEYDRRRSGFSNAPVNAEYGNNITEK